MFKKLAVVITAVLITCNAAFALPINGSITLGSFNGATLSSGADLSSPGAMLQLNVPFLGAGLKDFSGVTPGTLMASTLLDLGNLGAYAWNSSVGAWTTSSGIITLQNATNLNITLTGTFTPAGILSGYGASNSLTELISFNMSGSSVSYAASLDSSPVPEPGTIVLFGGGIFALAIFGKRRINNA